MAANGSSMLSWITVLKLLLSLAGTVATYLHNAKLMEAGQAKSILAGIHHAQRQTKIAADARANVKHDADSVSNDPDDRRNQ